MVGFRVEDVEGRDIKGCVVAKSASISDTAAPLLLLQQLLLLVVLLLLLVLLL